MRQCAISLSCVLALAACGDNLGPCSNHGVPAEPAPCATGTCTDVHVVAHEDDDLLFMNPDIESELAGGHHVVVVYVTAGELDDPTHESYWRDRERGMLAAYAFMLHGGPLENRDGIAPTWQPQLDALAGLTFRTYRDGAVTLVFLRLGDFQTQCLWEDTNGCSAVDAHPVAPPYLAATKDCADCPMPIRAQQVSREQLIDLLAQLYVRESATTIATLDSTALFFDAVGPAGDGYHEYPDHYFSGLFATAAAARARTSLPTLQLRSYRGYTIARAAPNLTDDEACTKLDVFAHYAMYDSSVVKPARRERFVECPSCYFRDAYGVTSSDSWEHRELVTATTEPPSFTIRQGDQCITDTLALGDCANAAAFMRTSDGQLATTGGCVSVTLAGGHVDTPVPDCGGMPCAPVPPTYPAEPLELAPCGSPTEATSLFVLENGQIRTPAARCLSSSGGLLASDDCRPKTAHGHVGDEPESTQAWKLENR